MIGGLQARQRMLLAGLLASSILVPLSLPAAQGEGGPGITPSASATPAPPLVSALSPSRSTRGAMMFRRIWGVDDLQVKQIASGELIRFSWRVVDPIAPGRHTRERAPILDDLL